MTFDCEITLTPTLSRDTGRGSNAGGFTFIELLSVVLVLGISAAVIVPQFSTHDDLQTTAAARFVMADLMYAQNRAIATQKKHYVEFTGSSYTLYARNSDASPLAALTNPLTGNNYTMSLGHGNTRFAETQITSINFDNTVLKAIQFDSLGLPSVYNPTTDTAAALVGTGTILLTTTDNTFPTAITIDPTSGEATVATQ